jgi:2,4-dichlorophenol 6-monooxygenase
MGQRYDSSAVVPDGTSEPDYQRDRELYYHPTTWPGARLPHVWLESHGRQVSTLDLAGKGRFSLFTGIGGEAWVAAARAISKNTGVEIATFVIGPGRDATDIFGEWPDLRGTAESGCILVRPDAYVGWRHNEAVADAFALLSGAVNSILGHGPRSARQAAE